MTTYFSFSLTALQTFFQSQPSVSGFFNQRCLLNFLNSSLMYTDAATCFCLTRKGRQTDSFRHLDRQIIITKLPKTPTKARKLAFAA